MFFHFISLAKSYRRKLLLVIFLLFWVLFSVRWYLLQPPSNTTLPNGARLEWKSCSFSIPFSEIIHCATLFPSLQNKKSTLSLPVIVIKNIGIGKHDDPVLHINGGPGAATGFKNDDIDYWLEYINPLNWNRDFIFYDQRGTGESTPKIECLSFYDLYYDNLTSDLTNKEEIIKIYNKHKECREDLKEFNDDFTGYSTKHNTQDLVDLTHLLNYKKLNLYGVSYGTRVALEVMRTQPSNIRSVILDSVFPSDKHGLLSWPAVLDNAINMIFERCKNNDVCHSKYPNLPELFTISLSKLKTKSIYLHMPEYYSDGSLDVYINDARFLEALFFSMYSADLISIIPDAINDVIQGTNEALILIVTAYADAIFDRYTNTVIFHSVLCNDDNYISRVQYEKEVDRYPTLRKYTTGIWDNDTCHIWKSKKTTKLSIEPVKSTIPTLILAAKDDHVTPWQWGEEVHQNLTNSIFFVFSDISHGVLDNNDCVSDLGRKFLTNLKIADNQSCI